MFWVRGPLDRHVRVAAVAVALGGLVVSLGACSSASASPSPMGLTGGTWQLTAITEKTPAFQGVVPEADQTRYTVTFNNDGTAAIKADCNNVKATYTSSSSGDLAITMGPSTLAACPPGSLDQQYVTGLAAASSYKIDGTTLTMTLKDGGTLTHVASK